MVLRLAEIVARVIKQSDIEVNMYNTILKQEYS